MIFESLPRVLYPRYTRGFPGVSHLLSIRQIEVVNPYYTKECWGNQNSLVSDFLTLCHVLAFSFNIIFGKVIYINTLKYSKLINMK